MEFARVYFHCRNYFLIVSKVRAFTYLKEARLALKDIGIHLPSYIPRGSSVCIIGYKGKEDISTKYVIGSPKEKASFLSMNITLPSSKIIIFCNLNIWVTLAVSDFLPCETDRGLAILKLLKEKRKQQVPYFTTRFTSPLQSTLMLV